MLAVRPDQPNVVSARPAGPSKCPWHPLHVEFRLPRGGGELVVRTKADLAWLSRYLWPLLLGAVVVGAGFGALVALAIWSDYPPDLPGLVTYRSATFGDAIALPVLAAVLLAVNRS